MQKIKLTNSDKVTLIDDSDFERVSQFRWRLQNTGYAIANINGKAVLLHRFIMEAPKGSEIDHRNRNKLDNTRSNIHFCTRSENLKNRNTWFIKGSVYFYKTRNQWAAAYQRANKRHFVGRFETKEQAQDALQTILAGVN